MSATDFPKDCYPSIELSLTQTLFRHHYTATRNLHLR